MLARALRASRGATTGRRFLSMRPRTMYDKIWDEHVVEAGSDGNALLYIDRHLVHEVTSPQAFEGLAVAGRPVRRPDCTLVTVGERPASICRSRTLSRLTPGLRSRRRPQHPHLVALKVQGRGVLHRGGAVADAGASGATRRRPRRDRARHAPPPWVACARCSRSRRTLRRSTWPTLAWATSGRAWCTSSGPSRASPSRARPPSAETATPPRTARLERSRLGSGRQRWRGVEDLPRISPYLAFGVGTSEVEEPRG